MTGPPTARPSRNIRLSPADGIALSHDRYDLRARDGMLICHVSRDHAERGIATGTLELWRGPDGAYLRAAASLVYPEHERRHAESHAKLPAPPRGAVPPVVYTSRHTMTGQVGCFRTRRVGPA